MQNNIVAIGVDTELVDRFRKMNQGDKSVFLKKIFSEEEIISSKTRFDSDQFLCARFSAKEAACKALSQLNIDCLPDNQLSIQNDEKGRPNIFFNFRDDNINKKLENIQSLVSISHNELITVAFVVLIQNTDKNGT
ncbi:MAG: holo-ACP synthase [Candidatus Heimdallarchaeota archaeon]|nr:holo-ACP synthase [Candidatus Heimdallarchaeota archaeon]MCK4612649.1 holo-ACP synthase [Candidatus Heimdallarchaeota archaeon]